MNEQKIFLAALEIDDPAERAAYLDAACGGDAALRRRLDALLGSHAQAGSFLESSPVGQMRAAAAGTDSRTEAIRPRPAAEPTGVPAADPGATQAEPGTAERAGASLDFLAASDRPGSLGRLGHYEVLEVVGQGGMGVVLKAFDQKLHRVVAIKVLAPQLATSGTARQRFIREAQAAAAVSHDHVVAIHAVEADGPTAYLVMQFIDGISLQDRIAQGGPLPLKEVLRIGTQIARGLAAAHKQGLVHRDVKPANILLENGVQRVKITDFGLARLADDASLTQSGVIAGTPLYMSPEQAGGEHVDHRSDLFSLGSVLYTLCTGRPPFRAGPTVAVLKRVCEDTPRSIRAINADVPDWLETLIDKLLAKAPADRIQSAAEVAEALEQQLAWVQQPVGPPPPVSTASPTAAHEPGPAIRSHAGRRRRRILAASLCGVLLAAGVVGTFLYLNGGDREPGTADQGQEQARAGRPSIVSLDLDRKDIPPHLLALAGGGDPAQAPPELVAVLGDPDGKRGPAGAVYTLAISPDGRTLASGGADSVVRIWDLADGKEVRTLTRHAAEVHSLAFSPQGNLLASGSPDGTAVLWDTTTGKEVHTLPGYSREYSTLAFSPDGQTLAAGGEDGGVKLWEVATGRPRDFVRWHTGVVRCVAFSPDGRLLASGGNDKMVQVCEAATGRRLYAFRAEAAVTGVAFTADGQTLGCVTDGPDGMLRFWDLSTKKEVKLIGPKGSLVALALHPGGSLAAAASLDGTVRLWDRVGPDGRQMVLGPGPFGKQAWDVAFTPDGRYLAAGGANGIISLLRVPKPSAASAPGSPMKLPDPAELAKRPSPVDALKGEEVPADLREKLPPEVVAVLGPPTFALPEGNPSWMAVNGDGKMLAVPCGDKVVLFDAQTGRLLRTLVGHTGRVYCAAFSPDGKRVAAGNWGEAVAIKLWDAQTGEEKLTLEGHASNVNSLAFSPDGKRLASVSADGTARVWDAEKGAAVHTLEGHAGAVFGVAFAPDGKRLATAGEDKTVRLWDPTSGKGIKALESHEQGVMRVAFSPDGKRLVSGNEMGWKLWDAETLAEVRTVAGPAGWLAFAPDGKSLLTGRHNNSGNPDEAHTVTRWDMDGQELATLTLKGKGGWAAYALNPDGKTLFEVGIHVPDRTVRAYDTATGTERARQGHDGPAFAVAFSPDGKWLASAGADATVRLWDLPTRELRHTLQGHRQAVRAVAFSPDSTLLASGGGDAAIKMWNIATGQERQTLGGHTGEVRALAFAPDGAALASSAADGTVKLWDVSTGKVRRAFRGEEGAVESVAFSPDGRTVAAGEEGGVVDLWDVATGWRLGTLRGPQARIRCVAFHPDGLSLAASTDHADGVIRLWDLAALREKPPLAGHTSAVLTCAWRADGRLLASCGTADGSVRLWDTTTSPPACKGLPIHPPEKESLHALALTPEGRCLAVANADGSIYLLRLAGPGEVLRIGAAPDGP